MGGDSYSKGRGFESQCCKLDGHFFSLICLKICNDVCLKRPKINNKRGRCWPNKKRFWAINGHKGSLFPLPMSSPLTLIRGERLKERQNRRVLLLLLHLQILVTSCKNIWKTNLCNSLYEDKDFDKRRDQWDQIGPYLTYFGDKFSYKSSQNLWWLFGPILKIVTVQAKTIKGQYLGNLWNIWATFYSVIWSHCSRLQFELKESE